MLTFTYEKKKTIFNAKNILPVFFTRVPPIVYKVLKKSVAEKAGIRKGDKIIGINKIYILFVDQYFKIITSYKNKLITLSFKRKGDLYQKIFKVNGNGNIGILFRYKKQLLELETTRYNVVRSFSDGIKKTFESITTQIKLFKHVFNIKNYKQVSRIFYMTKAFSSNCNWEIFWKITANLSIWLAYINILPIPSLDGGYVLFILIEIITTRNKLMEKAIFIVFTMMTILIFIYLGNTFLKIH